MIHPSSKNWQWHKIMMKFALALPASHDRAQALHIARRLKWLDFAGGETIANMMIEDHRSYDAALRHSRLIVEAGLATYETDNEMYFGTFTYIDGSILN